MTEPSVRDRVLSCFELVLPDIAIDELTTLTSQDERWDSLASITLLAAIEEEFETMFSDDEVAAMTSFDAVVTTAQSRDRQDPTG